MEFKDVVGYEGFYKVSQEGHVWSVRRERQLSLNLKPNGYVYVQLNVKGVAKTHRVHRLVASAFLSKPLDKFVVVNHKNGNKSDNNVENLEWVTPRENNLHAIREGLASFRKNTYSVVNTVSFEETVLEGTDAVCSLVGFTKPTLKKYSETLSPYKGVWLVTKLHCYRQPELVQCS